MSLRCESHRLVPRAAIERFQEWIYQTDHLIEALVIAEYFSCVSDRLRTGDVIEAYAKGLTRMQYLRLVVAKSERNSVVVAPFTPSHRIEGASIQSATLLPNVRSRNSHLGLELSHLAHGAYRIVDGNGDAVVGDIKGHELPSLPTSLRHRPRLELL